MSMWTGLLIMFSSYSLEHIDFQLPVYKTAKSFLSNNCFPHAALKSYKSSKKTE